MLNISHTRTFARQALEVSAINEPASSVILKPFKLTAEHSVQSGPVAQPQARGGAHEGYTVTRHRGVLPLGTTKKGD